MRLPVCLAAVVALALSAGAAASPPPTYVYRYVAFVTLTGHGTVTTVPKGIDCPRECRGVWKRGTHIRFVAKPAAGWRFAGYSSKWCGTGENRPTCAFDLVSPHDCVGGACPLGAFGVQALFLRE